MPNGHSEARRMTEPMTAAPTAAGVDIAALPASLAGRTFAPGEAGYAHLRHSYTWRGTPALVIQPRTAAEVSDAVVFARKQGVPLAVRSGGHGISGRSTNTGGIVIDLRKMNAVTILDRARKLVRLEPGARWGDVAEILGEHGLAMSSGDYGNVGVGGLATAGGLGYLARKYGLTIDHIVAAEVVLADGRIVRSDADHEPELLWAIRGAGANFGIVTAFELEAYEIGHVVQAIQMYDASNTAAFLERWGRLLEESPREVTSFVMLFPRQGLRPVTAQAITVYAGDDVDAASEALTRLGDAGPLRHQRAHLAPYPAIVPAHDSIHGGNSIAAVRSGLSDHLTREIADAMAEMLRCGDAAVAQIRSIGGAVNDVSSDAMAYSHRTQNFSLIAGADDHRAVPLGEKWDGMRPHLKGTYLSFETDTHPDRLLEAFPEPTLTRLRFLKAKYDPDNVFNTNFAIPPAVAG